MITYIVREIKVLGSVNFNETACTSYRSPACCALAPPIVSPAEPHILTAIVHRGKKLLRSPTSLQER